MPVPAFCCWARIVSSKYFIIAYCDLSALAGPGKRVQLDIKYILKSLRYLRSAIRFMTSSEERKLLRMQAKYDIVDTRFM